MGIDFDLILQNPGDKSEYGDCSDLTLLFCLEKWSFLVSCKYLSLCLLGNTYLALKGLLAFDVLKAGLSPFCWPGLFALHVVDPRGLEEMLVPPEGPSWKGRARFAGLISLAISLARFLFLALRSRTL